MKLLDLFCGAGGAAVGYQRAGFDVLGVDIRPQPHYPFPFVQADALDYCREHGHEYDVIHASPPCQAYSTMRHLHTTVHPDLIAATRTSLEATGRYSIIENVPGAPLRHPVVLCGLEFCLAVYRHRLFETNFPVEQPQHDSHERGNSRRIVCFGVNADSYAVIAPAMRITWPMTRQEIRQAIPPAYTEYVGRQLLECLR